MKTFYLSFRIASRTLPKGSYQQRYDKLNEAIRSIANGYWMVPTSFWFFGSEKSRKQIAALVRSILDADYDEAVIGMPDFKGVTVIGASKEDVEVLASLIADLDAA